MPERIDGLTRADISELFDMYARANTPRELRELTLTDDRFRRPAFHAMLRQEHVSLRHRADMDEELKHLILLKYHLFFRLLHMDVHRTHVNEIRDARSLDSGPMPAHRTPGAALKNARSGAELVLALVAELLHAGTLKSSLEQGNVELPVLVDRRDPSIALHRLLASTDSDAAAVCERLISELPTSRDTLAACLLYWCLACNRTYPAIHRYYVGARAFGDVASEVLTSSCPECGSSEVAAMELLADESTGEIDPLLASACLIEATPHRILVAPPLTVRHEEHDRILEIRLAELEEHCRSVFPAGESEGMLMYSLVYSPDELEARLSDLGHDEQMKQFMGRRLVEEVVRKVDSGVLPLDMAMEHVRKFARADPELAPPIPLYSDTGGDPETHLTAILVTKAIYEEREEAFDLKALLTVMASEAYDRVGARGLAAAELERARELREHAEGGLTEVVDRLLATREAQHAMDDGKLDVAIVKLEALVQAQMPDAKEDLPGTAFDLAEAYNRMGTINQLGVMYDGAGRLDDALRSFATVETSVQRYTTSPMLDPDAADEASLISSLRYIASGAIANQGSMCRSVAHYFRRVLLPAIEEYDAGMSLSHLAAAAEDIEPVAGMLRTIAELMPGAQDTRCADISHALLAEAVRRYARSLEISEAVGGNAFAAVQAYAVFELHRELKDQTNAELETYLQKAIDHARQASSLSILWTALASLSHAREESGSLEDAAVLNDEALRVLLRIRVASGLEEVRSQFGTDMVSVAARSADLHHRLGDPAKATEAIETAKCSLLSLELERSSLRLRELDAADPAIEELNALQAARRRLWTVGKDGASATRLLQPELRTSQPAASIEDLEKIDDRIDELRRALRIRHPRFDAWCRWSTIAPFHLSDLERVAWREAVRVIGFLVASDRLWWYNIEPGTIRTGSVPLGEGGPERLSAMLVRIRGRIVRDALPIADCTTLLDNVAELLAPAFASLSGDAPVVISPHDSLLWLPWSLLPVGKRSLAELAPIYVVPGLSILETIAQRATFPAAPAILVVADPQKGGSGALPEAVVEARMLAERFGVRCVVLEGKDATIEAVFRNAPGKDILHFCCHGSFGGFGTDIGQLFLAGDTAGAGVLTCDNIVENLQLTNTILVNLAACESGLVRPEQGTEIDGITRAFLCAGANAVLGSLWPLHDREARIFSERFYAHLDGTRDPARALWQTQRACLRNEYGEMMAKPVNWAGYVLVGAPAGTRGEA